MYMDARIIPRLALIAVLILAAVLTFLYVHNPRSGTNSERIAEELLVSFHFRKTLGT